MVYAADAGEDNLIKFENNLPSEIEIDLINYSHGQIKSQLMYLCYWFQLVYNFYFRITCLLSDLFKVPPKLSFAKLKAKEPGTAAISKSEIHSWVATASVGDMSDDQQEQVWQRDRVLNDWPKSVEYAQNVLLNAKTKDRIIFLQDEILSLAKHGGSDIWIWICTFNDMEETQT